MGDGGEFAGHTNVLFGLPSVTLSDVPLHRVSIRSLSQPLYVHR